jgi:predicted ester cyclase
MNHKWAISCTSLNDWHEPAAVPDLKMVVLQRLVVGDRVVSHLRFTGHFNGTFMGHTGTVKYPAQATPVRSSVGRVRENRTHGLKGDA